MKWKVNENGHTGRLWPPAHSRGCPVPPQVDGNGTSLLNGLHYLGTPDSSSCADAKQENIISPESIRLVLANTTPHQYVTANNPLADPGT